MFLIEQKRPFAVGFKKLTKSNSFLHLNERFDSHFGTEIKVNVMI